MFIKKVFGLSLCTVLALFLLLVIPKPDLVHASPLNCTWTGATNNNFSNANNWSNCNSAAPVTGSNLIFDDTGLSSYQTLDNDMNNLSVGTITFQGSNSKTFSITGNAISVSGGIVQNASSDIEVNLNLTANQSFSGSTWDTFQVGTTLNIGSNTLTIDDTGGFNASAISGSGTLILDATNVTYGNENIDGSSPNFTGTIQVDSGNTPIITGTDINGANIVVQSGGSVNFNATQAAETLTDNFTLAGNGNGNLGSITSCLDEDLTCEGDNENTNLTISGTVDLTGNTEVANGAYYVGQSSPPTNSATFTFTGAVTYNNFTLTAIPNSNTTVVLPAAATSGSTGSSSAPGTPDTGVGLFYSRPVPTLVISAISFISIVVLTKYYLKTRTKS